MIEPAPHPAGQVLGELLAGRWLQLIPDRWKADRGGHR
jgi:hypothetical protein